MGGGCRDGLCVPICHFAGVICLCFRHSFEKRMLETGLDYGLRCTLMGHRNPRPEYGDGGSLTYRRDEMLKIVHPVSDALLASYPFTAKP